MTPQERDLLAGLFDRLKQADANPREADAERFIAEAVRRQPSAPYLMSQLLLVQDQALTAAQTRISQLERDVGKARTQPAAAQVASGRSSLGDGPPAGPWGAQRAAARSPGAVPSVSPPGFAPGAQQAQGGTGGFLRGALQTAAGVAGGALLFQGLSSLFHGANPWGGAEETASNEADSGSGEETAAADPAPDDAAPDQVAADEPPADDGGWFDGGGDDLV
jgi:uncharacterized protein